ncbi:alanine racemase [Sphingosinicella terrae]|uniref:alanine racemase n=1 Tax=Sphingosinicella terrae TaxID=2172047 RepID=UPI000E0D56BB|nr:alanine racemase [Sphingosinicella terrae]
MILDWRIKGLPPRAEGLSPAELVGLGLSLLDGDLMMPAAIVREEALARNVREMQAFADRHGALLCPHGKTSMSPELFRMQLEAGAWGMTAATAHHVRIYRRLGIGRVFLANSLAGRADLEFVVGELAADSAFDFYALVDSPATVDLWEKAARKAGLARPVQLLVETGMAGGRAGVRSVGEAVEVARHIAGAAPWLALRGAETFEGIHPAGADGRLGAADMIDVAIIAAHDMIREGLLAEGPLLLSAGGSAFLDLCAAKLPARIEGREVVRIIRPGCYVTHDSGCYHRIFAGGLPESAPPGADLPRLAHALEVWAPVLSVPEPGLAIVGAGKRDFSYDLEPPIPLHVYPIGNTGKLEPADGLCVTRLWDQHAALSMPDSALTVGDLVGFGISHPCATFDRWRALLTVDRDYRVTGAVTTLF